MARKKSAKTASEKFKHSLVEIDKFIEFSVKAKATDKHLSWTYEYALIRAYREFETFVLECLVCAINNDSSQLSAKKGFDFPKHLTDEVCEYIIVGENFFDFRGRSGLIKTTKNYVADDHYFLTICKKPQYKSALDQLIALRNFAAHDSAKSKLTALKAVELQRMSSAGSYLKTGKRWKRISKKLSEFAEDVKQSAPF